MFLIPKIDPVYTNALLATLNARKKRSAEDNIHNFDTCTDAIGTLSLRGLSNPGNSLIGPFPTQQSDIPNMSINVDTTKEIVTDLVHDEEQPHDKDKIEVRFSVISVNIRLISLSTDCRHPKLTKTKTGNL